MFIDRKHAVGIAIESRTEIGSDLQYFLLQRHQVLRLDGTGRVVGKGAIQFKVERDEMRGRLGRVSFQNTCNRAKPLRVGPQT